jgi:hypothetical protein
VAFLHADHCYAETVTLTGRRVRRYTPRANSRVKRTAEETVLFAMVLPDAPRSARCCIHRAMSSLDNARSGQIPQRLIDVVL